MRQIFLAFLLVGEISWARPEGRRHLSERAKEICVRLLSNPIKFWRWYIVRPPEVVQVFGEPSHPVLTPESRVVIWNTFKGRIKGWVSDFRALSENADLVLLQEVSLSKDTRDLLGALGPFEWTMATQFLRAGVPSGVVTGARTPLLRHEYISSPIPEPVTKTPKMTLLSWYRIAGATDPLLVANVHAINFVALKHFKENLHHIESRLMNHRGPILLAGDFNTWSTARLWLLFAMADRLGLSSISFARDNRARPFDHAFVRGLEPSDAKILAHIGTSDHKPLIFRLSLKTEEP